MAAPDSRISNDQPGIREEVRIPMRDGIELAATLYLPDPAHGPQPCLIEALPYRKDDVTSSYEPEYLRLRDEYHYAVCRIDVRGTGSSGGRATDEYPEAEQKDLAEAMTWLAAQEWCTGHLGMYGTSYSGFNSLQMACERPPELKAIIAIFATDDRYTDDVHYRGGALKFTDLLDYCSYMTSLNALPPVPAVWGDGWREEWHARLAEHEPWVLTWLREQRDSPYWRHGSVNTDYDRIACPTMVIAGWADGYRNASYRLIERLRGNDVPHHLLAGPWAHAALDGSLPGPRIDGVETQVRWWDRWLRGRDTGVDDGLADSPAMTLFVRTSTRPSPTLDTHKGFWIREEWPCPRVQDEVLLLDGRAPYVVDPSVGVDAWIDCAALMPWGQSGDLRADDAASLTWDFDADGRTLIGQPVVRLRVSVDQPVAYLAVKINDVFPDGTSALVTRALLNLTHRDGHDQPPSPLVPGEVYDVDVELDACAFQFDAGQRLRVSVAGADWPNTGVPPAPVTMTVHGGEVVLPCWSGASPHAEPDLPAPADPTADHDYGDVLWQIERDVLKRVVRARVDYGGVFEGKYGSEIDDHNTGHVEVDLATFGQRSEAKAVHDITWPEASVSSVSYLTVEANADSFVVAVDLVAKEGDEVVVKREWRETIPRDLA